MLFLLSIPAKNPIRRFGWRLLPKVTALLKDSLELRESGDLFVSRSLWTGYWHEYRERSLFQAPVCDRKHGGGSQNQSVLLEFGCLGYFHKPVDSDVLREQLADMMQTQWKDGWFEVRVRAPGNQKAVCNRFRAVGKQVERRADQRERRIEIPAKEDLGVWR